MTATVLSRRTPQQRSVGSMSTRRSTISKSQSARTTVARKRGHRREQKEPLKPFRRECRLNPSEPVATTLVCFSSFAARDCGFSEHPAFPAPAVAEGYCWTARALFAWREHGFLWSLDHVISAQTRGKTGVHFALLRHFGPGLGAGSLKFESGTRSAAWLLRRLARSLPLSLCDPLLIGPFGTSRHA
jgi:hypothetical protein